MASPLRICAFALRSAPRHPSAHALALRPSALSLAPARTYASNASRPPPDRPVGATSDAVTALGWTARLAAPALRLGHRLRPSVIRERTRAWWAGCATRAWWWARLRQTALFLAHALNIFFAVHLIFAHVGRLSVTYGPSMLPTFATSGEIVLEDRLSYRHLRAPLVRGDLVIVESPIARGQMICKRLIGLPGDVVCVDPTGRLAPSTEHVVVPKGHVWISGDNAEWSRDSREYGPVPIALVKGRIVARVWPPSKFTIYPSGSGVNFLT